MTRKQKRLAIIGGALAFLGLAVALVLFALRQEIVFFHSPTDLQANPVHPGERIRLGGLVEKGSVDRGQGTKIAFTVTDTNNTVRVRYDGLLPDLFREEQGVVAEGTFAADGTFVADTVLAKHDENYMPREVAESLKEQGVWQGKE
jgi:cytochrome c-type biogenesis protein CcmE